MKISGELIIGLALNLVSVYYWGTVGRGGVAPLFYRYSFRLYPYLDIVLTFLGMLLFYRGLMKLRK